MPRSFHVRLMLVAFLAAAAMPCAAIAQPKALSHDDFFDDSAVRDINIVINSKDWAALKSNFESNTYYPCSLTWNGVTVKNVGARSRGHGSRSPVKPGLRIDFDRYAAAQTYLGMKSFILDNLLQDPSMLKEWLSMLFFRRMGLPAPRETYVRLLINGQYVGLYAAVESIDKGFLGRTFGEDNHGGTENDGYLFEYEWRNEYRFEYLGDKLDAYSMFKPKTRENDAAAKIWGPIEKMIKAINQSSDALFVQDVSPYIDLRLFAKQLAVENFLAELDGILGYAGLNNFYLYRFEDRNLSQFLAWDKDNTFFMIDYPLTQGVAENVLARRTLARPQFKNIYIDTLKDAAASASEPEVDESKGSDKEKEPDGPGWLEREILREYRQIRTLARGDTLKPWTNDEFEAAVQSLIDFARQRPAFVIEEAAKLR